MTVKYGKTMSKGTVFLWRLETLDSTVRQFLVGRKSLWDRKRRIFGIVDAAFPYSRVLPPIFF
jgi:hypothetical protein